VLQKVVKMKAKQIANLRASLGWSQEKFAELIGTHRVTVARWETGVSEPDGAAVRILKVVANSGKLRADTDVKRPRTIPAGKDPKKVEAGLKAKQTILQKRLSEIANKAIESRGKKNYRAEPKGGDMMKFRSAVAHRAVEKRRQNILLEALTAIVNAPRNRDGDIVLSTKPESDALYQKACAAITKVKKK
jgi:transcriptional regulator with XRE-family HTH domain